MLNDLIQSVNLCLQALNLIVTLSNCVLTVSYHALFVDDLLVECLQLQVLIRQFALEVAQFVDEFLFVLFEDLFCFALFLLTRVFDRLCKLLLPFFDQVAFVGFRLGA